MVERRYVELPGWIMSMFWRKQNVTFILCFYVAVGIHRIIEWPGLKRTTMIISFQPPCYLQGCQPPDQAAQSHIQPGLECLQGWGIQNLLGQPVQCVTTLWVKNFFLISNLNLPCLSLKPFHMQRTRSSHISLLTVVYHHGNSATGGHYTTDVFQIGLNGWLRIDDQAVKVINQYQVVKPSAERTAYLLYYRRVDLLWNFSLLRCVCKIPAL